MVGILTLLWAISAIELCLWLLPSLAWQRVAAPFVAVLLSIISGALFLVHPNVPIGVVSFMSLYRLVNLVRLASARIHQKYLRRATIQASLWVIGLQLAVLAGWYAWSKLHIPIRLFWLLLVYADTTGALVLLTSSLRHLRTTRPPLTVATDLADADLPTLTVAIPARNETSDLEACLTSLVASDYPKLEILVLDDCSQNRHTPEIIRSFAHAGVRFVQGRPTDENWLAKNQAYQQLFEESNGTLILYCGVDVRFSPESLRLLVLAMLHKHKTMISLIPRNVVPTPSNWRQSIVLQPMRYAWELALPRRLFRRPPVLSTCWIVRREVIDMAGGFGAVSRSIVPESYFARVSAVRDGYSFMQSSSGIGVISTKSLPEQLRTVIRTRYPQVHRRLELVMLLTLVETGGVVLPYWVLITSLLNKLSLQLDIVSAASLSILVIAYSLMVSLTYRKYLVRSLVAMPIAVLIDVGLLNYSMFAYEFLTVSWKGRNVCLPVMRAAARPLEPAPQDHLKAS